MKRIVVPSFACPDVVTFVRAAAQDDIFKQSNHDGEILYVQVQAAEGLTPVVDERGRPVLRACEWKYEEIRHQLRLGKHMVFMSIDSFRNEQVFVQGGCKVQDVVFVQEMEQQGHTRYFYYGEDAKGEVLKAVKSKVSCVAKGFIKSLGIRVNMVFPQESMEKAREFEKGFKSVRKRLLFISGMLMPQVTVVSEKGAPSRKVIQYDVLVNEWWTKLDDYDDVRKIVQKVTSIDDVSFFRNLQTGIPLYPEYIRKMMWYATAYVKMGDPVFNLILSGEPGVSKSSALAVYANLFSVTAKTPIGSGGTKKGLVPSFAGDVPREGALIKEPWFAPVDEFFDMSTAEAAVLGIEKVANMHRKYIRQLLPVVSRSPLRYPSAKDDEFECVMEASLMATDNLVPKTREALKALVEEDPATLRRFCVVWMGQDVKQVVRASPAGNIDDNMEFLKKHWLLNYGFDVHEMKRFGEWFRDMVVKIKVDGVRCMELQREVVGGLLMFAGGNEGALVSDESVDVFCRSVDFSIHIMAMVRCEAMMRVVYVSDGEMLPEVPVVTEGDYETAKILFGQVMHDSMFLFDISSWAHLTGGVQRVI